MKWEEFVKIVGDLPIIESEILLAGVSKIEPFKVQISRWQKAGNLIQLKRGVYLLSEPFRKVTVYEPYVASVLKKPSYISVEKALEYHNLIPESVSVYSSVTTKRSGKFSSRVGTFDYRHIKETLFWGYNSVTVNKQTGFVASPEKALLDFFYLNGVKISSQYLKELRLQNLAVIDLDKLFEYGRRFEKPGILSVCKVIKEYVNIYQGEEKTL